MGGGGVQIANPGTIFQTRIFRLQVGSFSYTPAAAIAAGAVADATVTITGLRAGDVVLCIPPNDLEDDLFLHDASVSANDTLNIGIGNEGAGPVTGAARTWLFVWFDMTE